MSRYIFWGLAATRNKVLALCALGLIRLKSGQGNITRDYCMKDRRMLYGEWEDKMYKRRMVQKNDLGWLCKHVFCAFNIYLFYFRASLYLLFNSIPIMFCEVILFFLFYFSQYLVYHVFFFLHRSMFIKS